MCMDIYEITDNNTWKAFLEDKPVFEFLQSANWSKFSQKQGKKVICIVIKTNEKEYYTQIIIQKIFFGLSFASLVRVDSSWNSEIFLELSTYLKKKYNCVFIRVEPVSNIEILSSIRILNRQWKNTLLLDIKQSEDELMAQMHSKHRYNIRLSKRKGVEIKIEKDVDIFWDLNKETKKRDNFSSHDKDYYDEMLKLENVYQYTAYFEDKPICTGIFIHTGKRFVYVHGASSNSNRNVMAPYLLQWRAILCAKECGATEYDFGGIAEKKEEGFGVTTCFHTLCWDPVDKLSGVTRFKAGFGGYVLQYGDAFEYVLRPLWYKLFCLAKKIRKN
jgi:peptidoglycan pentaglycine glycine transferase (the first glycine)